jgi:hypothetical protein
MQKEKTQLKLKYDTRMVVSYPISTYEGIRKWSLRKGISMQDFQRKAAEFYIQHLEMDNMEFQNIKNK